MAQTTRRGYHHGDLANALVDEASALARQGGPEAVVLREAARRAGVSATAAYRHFTDQRDLLYAVKHRAQDILVDAMEAELARTEPLEDPLAEVRRRLRALGAAYIGFAHAEPGLFRTAFCHQAPGNTALGDPFSTRAYVMLNETLDRLVAAGAVTPERRRHLDTAAWAAVHGIAMLSIDGPLARLPEAELHAALERTLDVAVAGLIHG